MLAVEGISNPLVGVLWGDMPLCRRLHPRHSWAYRFVEYRLGDFSFACQALVVEFYWFTSTLVSRVSRLSSLNLRSSAVFAFF